jgi:RNA polymerase sigma-70 factor (ECF subfamily)
MLDADAFTRRLRPLLRRSGGYAFSLLRGRREAEDAVQQSALKAWERRAQFNDQYPFQAWWFGILRHHCLDELRREKRGPNFADLDDTHCATGPEEGALDRILLDRALGSLPEMHREVLTLRYFSDLSYQELALVLNIPKGTVMSRLHLARKALASLIKTEERL